MKQVALTILSLVILVSASPQATIYWVWKVNQTSIASLLCIEKEVLGNSCQGKCQLKAQLEANEDNNTRFPLVDREANAIQFYCVDLIDVSKLSLFIFSEKTQPKTVHLFHDSLFVKRMLRPPEILA